ncbi:MAG: hypothetical protein QXZ70_01665 [Candidatus Bathyarchaeia archaeon]
MSEETRLIIALKKITYPNGQKLTRALVPFDVESRKYNPNSETINKILPIIDKEYSLLIEGSREKGLTSALDQFLQDVSSIAIVGHGLISALTSDLNEDSKSIVSALLETTWFKSSIEYVRSEFKRMKKRDSIRYAETIRQIADIFGSDYAMRIFKQKGVSIKRSTLAALCRVAGETPRIKTLIREGKLKLTIAFELPNIAEKDRERIAEQISMMNYEKQKRYLNKIKENWKSSA